jgi:hypothetical protein
MYVTWTRRSIIFIKQLQIRKIQTDFEYIDSEPSELKQEFKQFKSELSLELKLFRYLSRSIDRIIDGMSMFQNTIENYES